MKVEIWSDVMCPFCYIGKRKFEKALDNFPHKNQIHVEWKSFLLNPDLAEDFVAGSYEYLAKAKNISMEETRQLHQHIAQQAQLQGLDFQFEKSKITSTIPAHRLLQWAKTQQKGSEMEERLFYAFFTEGKLVSDKNVLADLAAEVGLNKEAAIQMLATDAFLQEVQQDLYEAQQFQIRGVPFFIFDRKYAVSGAQETPIFAQALQKSFEEWQQNTAPSIENLGAGESCDMDGNCN